MGACRGVKGDLGPLKEGSGGVERCKGVVWGKRAGLRGILVAVWEPVWEGEGALRGKRTDFGKKNGV